MNAPDPSDTSKTESAAQPGCCSCTSKPDNPNAAAELSAEFWEDRYQTDSTGWDRGGASPQLLNWLESELSPPARVLVPCCGRGHEVIELAQRGFDVTALDYAQSALDSLASSQANQPWSCELVQADVLTYQPAQPFDAVYEQTALCALHPDSWARYEAQLASWLRPGGRLYALFMQADTPGGPPFHCAEADMRKLFPEQRWNWGHPHAEVPHPLGLVELAFVLERKPS